MSQFYYFTPCCGEQSFGIINNTIPLTLWPDFTDTVNTVYGLIIIGSYSGCATYSGTSTTQLVDLPFYNSDPIFLPYDTCAFCTTWIYPCYTPPVVTPPTIVGYKNECGIVTILPMGIQCVTSSPSTSDSYDGEVSLEITGGTPPYTTTWTWGNNNSIESPAIGGIGNGFYSATTVDYWGDFTSTTVCYLYTEPDCTFNVTIVEQDINNCLPTAMSGYTFDLT